MQILKLSASNKYNIIKQAVETLKNGGIVIYPTETCYGIGVDATNQEAVNKVLEYKSRREGKPLSVAVTGKEMASKYVKVNDQALNLYDNFLPGPLTVISKALGKVSKGVESEAGTLGIRVPDYELILEIVKELGVPVTSTSANASYQKRPYKLQDILDNISDKQKALVDLFIDVGELPHNDPSTVIDTTLADATVVRQGNIKLSSKLQVTSYKPEDTQKVGFDLMKKYSQYLGYKSVIFALKGELGAGKTEMTKGIARELNIKEDISSPTFIIESVYDIPGADDSYVESRNLEFIHMDTWRLFDGQELEELDFYKQVDNCNVFVIEWADKILDVLKRVSSESIIIWIEIEYGEGESERNIKVSDFE